MIVVGQDASEFRAGADPRPGPDRRPAFHFELLRFGPEDKRIGFHENVATSSGRRKNERMERIGEFNAG